MKKKLRALGELWRKKGRNCFQQGKGSLMKLLNLAKEEEVRPHRQKPSRKVRRKTYYPPAPSN